MPPRARTGSDGCAVFFLLFRARITQVLAAFPTRTIGLSINYLSRALCAFAVVGFAKTVPPELCVVLGGSLITSWVAQGSLAATERFGGLVAQHAPGLLHFTDIEIAPRYLSRPRKVNSAALGIATGAGLPLLTRSPPAPA
jgi:hypothetical protein